MTLEKEINKLIDDVNSRMNSYKYPPVEEWLWISIVPRNDEINEFRYIRYLIEKAPLEQCLISPSHYIREYKILHEQEGEIKYYGNFEEDVYYDKYELP